MRFHAPLSEISPLAQIPVVRLEGGVPRITLLVGFSSARRRQLAERDSRLPGHREELVFMISHDFVFVHPKLLLPKRPKLSILSWLFLGRITRLCFCLALLAHFCSSLVLFCLFHFLCLPNLLRAGLEFWVQASVRGESCAISRAEGTPVLSATNVHPRGLRNLKLPR